MHPEPASPSPQAQTRFATLDLLRLAAAAGVVGFHYTFFGAASDQRYTSIALPSFAPVAMYGYLGVNLFFVISGFVIAISARGRSAVQFTLARFCRVYPAFLFCLCLTSAVTAMAGDPHFTMSGLKFMANATFAIGVAPSLFMDGAYWSIVAELTFYFWIAALIATGVFAKRLTMAMVVWLLISAVCQMQPSSVILEHLFLTRSSGFFAAGVMIYVWREIERSPQTALVLSLATGMAALQSLHEAQWFEEHAGAPLQPTVVAGLSIACVLLVLLASSLRGARLPPRLMMALGGVTYPLYLLHQNIGYILFNRYPDAATPLAAITGVSAIMLATAFIVWRFVDIPGQRAMRRLVAPLAAWAESRAPKTSASRASAA